MKGSLESWVIERSEPRDERSVEEDLAYWTKALANLPEELRLPADRPRPAVATHRAGSVALRIPPLLHQRLSRLALENQTSLFVVLQAGLAALLSRLGAGADIP